MFEGEFGKDNSLWHLDGGLLRFLQPEAGAMSIATVECSNYLPELRTLFPAAKLIAITADEDIPQLPVYKGLDVTWRVLDYREEPLGLEKESLDYLLADRCLEVAANPQDIAAGFGTYIKQTGYLLTSFKNIRYWKVVQQLMNGHFYAVVRRLYSRTEFERLLYASYFKESVFSSQRIYAPEDLLEKLLTCGFSNDHHDLDTEYWFVKAARSTMEISALKSLYTASQRRFLVTLLRRIEYGIDIDDNVRDLWLFYDEAPLFPDYLAAFIRESIIHWARLYRMLIWLSPERRKELAATVNAALGLATKEKDAAELTRLLAKCQKASSPADKAD